MWCYLALRRGSGCAERDFIPEPLSHSKLRGVRNATHNRDKTYRLRRLYAIPTARGRAGSTGPSLQQALFRKGILAATADYYVIKHPNIQ